MIHIILYIAAVKRCYQNLRRTFLEQKEEKVEITELQAQKESIDLDEKGSVHVCKMFYFTNIYFSFIF